MADGMAREEAAEREARGGRAPSILSLICMQKRDNWAEMDRRWQAASSKLDKLDESSISIFEKRAGKSWGRGTETGFEYFVDFRTQELVGGGWPSLWGQKGPKKGLKVGGHISVKNGS